MDDSIDSAVDVKENMIISLIYDFPVFSFNFDPRVWLWLLVCSLFKFVVIVLLVNRHIETNTVYCNGNPMNILIII